MTKSNRFLNARHCITCHYFSATHICRCENSSKFEKRVSSDRPSCSSYLYYQDVHPPVKIPGSSTIFTFPKDGKEVFKVKADKPSTPKPSKLKRKLLLIG